MRSGWQHVLEAPTAMIARAMSSEALDLDRNGTATSANNALRGHVGDVDYRSRDGRDRYAQQPLAALEAAQLRHDSSRTVGRQHSSRTANLHANSEIRARVRWRPAVLQRLSPPCRHPAFRFAGGRFAGPVPDVY